MRFDSDAGEFVLTARADRIELTRDGYAHVLDFKTGRAPTPKEIETGFSPQLTLTAAIVAGGGFAGAGARAPGRSGLSARDRPRAGRRGDRAAAAGPRARTLADKALAGLMTLIARFDDRAPGPTARAPRRSS